MKEHTGESRGQNDLSATLTGRPRPHPQSRPLTILMGSKVQTDERVSIEGLITQSCVAERADLNATKTYEKTRL